MYILVTKYALGLIHLLFRISYLLQLTDSESTSFSFILTTSRVDAERLLNSMGMHSVGCSTAAELDSHWIDALLCLAHQTLSGGL